jgi:predicted RNase H-like HicB family nuclease
MQRNNANKKCPVVQKIFFASQYFWGAYDHRSFEVSLPTRAVMLLKASSRNLSVRSAGGILKMETGRLAFTAVYLKSNSGYIGFIEELPGVNSHGRTIEEARETLQKLAAVVFDEERRGAEELIAGKDVVRESFFVPIPRPA